MSASFDAIIRWQANQPACWFCLSYGDLSEGRGLWELLGAGPDAYHCALKVAGLVYKHGKAWRIKRDKAAELGTRLNLEDDSFYASTFKGGSKMYLRLGKYQDTFKFHPDDIDVAYASFQSALFCFS